MFIDLSSRKGANAVQQRVRSIKVHESLAQLMQIEELAQRSVSPLTIINMWAQCTSMRVGPHGRIQLKRGEQWIDHVLTDLAFSLDPKAVTEAARSFGLAVHSNRYA